MRSGNQSELSISSGSSSSSYEDVPDPVSEQRTVEGTSLSLSWRNVVYKVDSNQHCSCLHRKKTRQGPRTILDNVSGHVNAGELLALMGPSGSGKSTLLDVLAGRVTKGLSGDILINGAKPDRRELKKCTAYMTQGDTLHIPLTVRETLYFSAMLRLPSEMSSTEKEDRIDEVINELGLTKVANTKIGDNQNIRGVSGGERRRVSIGIELITKPSLLLVDEPTSGLDSKSARFLIELLRSLTRKGKTILCTIHQPSSYVFSLFDKVGLLSQGHVVYFGTIPGSVKFFKNNGHKLPPSTNPADFLIETINHDFNQKSLMKITSSESVAELISAFEKSEYYSAIQTAIETETKTKDSERITGSNSENSGKKHEKMYETSMLHQLWYLTLRMSLSWCRNPLVLGSKLGAYIVMGIAIGSIYFNLGYEQTAIQDRISALTFCTAFLMYTSLSSISELAHDRKIFVRERMNGYYSVLPYALANTIVGTVIIGVASIIFTFIVYFMVGFNTASLGYFICMLLATLWTAEAIVSFVSAVVATTEAAMAMVNAMFSVFMLCNGFIIRAVNIPPYWIWVHWISFCKYSFEGFMVSEFIGEEFPCIPHNNTDDSLTSSNSTQCDCFFPDTNENCILEGEEIMEVFAYNNVQKWAWFGVMMGFLVSARVMYYVSLRVLVTGKR